MTRTAPRGPRKTVARTDRATPLARLGTLDLKPCEGPGAADPVALRSATYLLRLYLFAPAMVREKCADDIADVLESVLAADLVLRAAGGEADDDGDDGDDDGELSPAATASMRRRAIAGWLQGEPSPERLAAFGRLLRRLEHRLGRLDDAVATNLPVIARTFDLSPAEAALLEFAVVKHLCEDLPSVAVHVRPLLRAVRALAAVVGHPVGAVEPAVNPNGRLRELGLLSELLGDAGMSDLDDLTKITAPVHRLLAGELHTPAQAAALVLRPLPPSDPALDFSYLKLDGTIVTELVRGAIAQRRTGVNILIHGRPGCGKTEFARALARITGFDAYQVSDADDSGKEGSRADRLASYQLTQRLIAASRGGFVVLDEAEDIFPADGERLLRGARVRAGGKAWVNRLLESNPWPAIWISNRVDHIDPAFLRRFQYVLPFPRPSRAARAGMAARVLGGAGLPAETLEALADLNDVTPALLTHTAQVLELAAPQAAQRPEVVRQVVRRYSEAVGLANRSPRLPRTLPYQLELLNLEGVSSPQRLLERLGRQPRTALLFYGPSGTGKTALAGHLAEQLGRRLVYRTASDLLSMWLGESEKQVRALFDGADADADLLFLDEADSLLGNRGTVTARHEVSITNEFLRGIEQYEGMFVCATNHLRSLEPALMRRFGFKVGFRPLAGPQRERLFVATAGGVAPSDEQRRRLERLDRLCIGDFANVARQLDDGGAPEPEALLEALEHESAHKEGAGQAPIGFA